MAQWGYRTFRSLRVQLGATFLGFLLLVGGSVVATFLAVHAQEDDAVVINLAGRQRMLTQKMAWLALTQPDSPDLVTSIQHFDQTLHALRDGGLALEPAGQSVILPPAPDSILRAQLDEVIQTWIAYQANLKRLASRSSTETSPAEAERALQTEASLLLAQLDAVVSGFEARAEAKLFRLQRIQAAFFVAALLLLAWGYFLVQRRIMSPLATLRAATRRIAEGSLAHPIPAMHNDEVGNLGQAFETMRIEVAAARNQLETRVAQRTRELTTAFEFSQEIVAELELDHLLSSVTDRARVLTQAQAAALCLLAPNGKYLDLAASSGETVVHPGLRQSVGHDLAAQVVCAGQTVVDEVACFNCDFLKAYTLGQCVATPLRAGEHTLGALCVVRPEQKFGPDETRALILLANSAAIAITNARLVEAERYQAEQAAVLTERERLAAELHDNLAQTLGFFNMKIGRVKALLAGDEQAQASHELDRVSAVVADTYSQVRQAIIGLQREAANDNLAQCLSEQVATFQRENGLPVHFSEPDKDAADIVLPPVAMGEVTRIVSEAIANAGKHAAAGQIEVALQRDALNETAIITVRDDGRGFDPRRAPTEEQGHFGLGLMRTRAARGNGELQIESMPGQGTQVTVRWPLTSDW